MLKKYDKSTKKPKIIVATLNWGLGHATRNIPIIKALEIEGFEPIIASDGNALALLKKEFPYLTHIELPSYNVTYSKHKVTLKWKILRQLPRIFKVIYQEKKVINKIIKEYQIKGIISDNRLGANSKDVPSVYITHQLNVMAGSLTWFSSKTHRYFIRKFDECWVPDTEGRPNLSGRLGHLRKDSYKIKYVGLLSRFQSQKVEIKYDISIVLSGPEPQRQQLEDKLIQEFLNYKGVVLLIQGIVEPEQKVWQEGSITCYNFMKSKQLESVLNESEIIVSRSGYTTVMDLARLGKKAFFIPTPGQYEQEYLAKRLKRNGYLPSCKQAEFSVHKLDELHLYKGLTNAAEKSVKWYKLFSLFQGE